MPTRRRSFLQQIALGAGAMQTAAGQPAATPAPVRTPSIRYPRVFKGRNLAMLAFPLGGVAAGSISLGGRGQLRDWEIFNKPDKGNSPAYAFPAIWAQSGAAKPVARVLEARFLPPYEGQNGLGSKNAPGLVRLDSATFTGEYPLAHIDFQDRSLPVKVSLDAFSPLLPLNADDSGLPVAFLRYTVTNPGASAAKVSIAWSIDSPVGSSAAPPASTAINEARRNEVRSASGWSGIEMTNPALDAADPLKGSFVVGIIKPETGALTTLRGWPRGRWWNSPMLFWDDFSKDGALGPEPEPRNGVASLCLQKTIEPGKTEVFTFVLAWHFPNRTPSGMGWRAAKGDEKTVVGNWYSTRFASAWDAADYAVQNLERLEKGTRAFAKALRESTLPGAIIEAASANLSTLATTTCFRTADGEFHGFEGVNDKAGCCYGNCTHVWNYETTTPYLFPTLARSLRKAAFGFSMDDAGAIHFRQVLPDGKERSGFAAADGQMGQILHAYIDWQLSGDNEWLRSIWPRVKKALEFAWIRGGWDADRDGVLEGVQHNTYDVEFYGPNPQCGIYYLGALRACEEMARAVGDPAAAEYRRLFENGSRWIDANLFNGEHYIQKIRGFRKDEVAAALRSSMGSDETEKPEYQVGEGCLVDQLVGQYLAEVAGLGPLTDPRKIRSTLDAIYKYNYKRNLLDHDSVQRIFALNDEAALVICDYGKSERPHIPFPYYAEVMTGFEYSAATHMLYAGMVAQGVECIANIRARYDGERRNPWNEAECGHHYARAMAAWSGILALSGFRYRGAAGSLEVLPRSRAADFRCIWSTATGWGTFRRAAGRTTVTTIEGDLRVQSIEVAGLAATVSLNGKRLDAKAERKGPNTVIHLAQAVRVTGDLIIEG